jgi:hypothetical protein
MLNERRELMHHPVQNWPVRLFVRFATNPAELECLEAEVGQTKWESTIEVCR